MFPLRKLALLAASAAMIGPGNLLLAQGQTTRAARVARAQSDLQADPAIRFGTLPNGMRYALRRNASPPGKVAVRLRIGAGSMVERDDQYGLAHFVEHMLYRGTTNMPGNTVVQRLQQEGLVFGEGIQGTTNPNDTVYSLDLPRGVKSLDLALQVMREQVSNAVMEPAAIEAERTVIEGEERTKNVPFIISDNARLDLVAPRLGARMSPIGDMNIIRTAGRDRLMEFYNAYYRPARAIVVITGDIEVDQVEAQVRRHFADWRPKGPAGPDADRQEAPRRKPTANIEMTREESVLAVYWIQLPDRSPDSRAKRRRALLRSLGVAVLSDRVHRASRAEGSPFTSLAVQQQDDHRAVDSVMLWGAYVPGQFDAAIAAFEQAPRQLLRYGITEGELREKIAVYRARLQEQALSSAGGHADSILAKLANGDVPITAETELALFDEAVKGLTPAEVTRALKPVFEPGNPLVMVSTPTPIPGGEAAVLAKLAAASRRPVSPPVQQAVVKWPYTDFGRLGAVVNRRVIPGLDVTVVTFANGTILSVKPTKERPGAITVDVGAGLGQRGMAKDRLDLAVGVQAYLRGGGLGKLTTEQLEQTLQGHVVSNVFLVEDDRFRWHGATNPADLALQMQLLAAMVTDPDLRPGPLERFKARYAAQPPQSNSTPNEALGAYARNLTGSNRAAPTKADVQALDAAVVGPRLREAIGRGPINVVMVGDVTIDQAIAATAATFGALPPRGSLSKPAVVTDQRPALPGGREVVQVPHTGDAAKALANVTWPGPNPATEPGEHRRAQVLAQVLQLRVTEVVRVREGLAYSPGVQLSESDIDRYASRFVVSAETTPANTAAFHAAMERIVRDLQAGPVTADELERARGPLINAVRGRRTGSSYWWDLLKHVGAGPDPVDSIEAEVADLQTMTTADVQMLARKYLRPEAAWRASVTPSTPAASPAAPARP